MRKFISKIFGISKQKKSQITTLLDSYMFLKEDRKLWETWLGKLTDKELGLPDKGLPSALASPANKIIDAIMKCHPNRTKKPNEDCHINLSETKISQFPKEAVSKFLTHLTSANFSHHKIKSISFLNNLNKLKVLELKNCEIKNIDDLKLPNLGELTLTDNKIKKINNLNLKKIFNLNLENNLINFFKNIEDQFPKIKFLSLKNNPIKSNSDDFIKLLQLRYKNIGKKAINLDGIKLNPDIMIKYNTIKTIVNDIRNQFSKDIVVIPDKKPGEIKYKIDKEKSEKEKFSLWENWLTSLKNTEIKPGKNTHAYQIIYNIMNCHKNKENIINLSSIPISKFPEEAASVFLSHVNQADFSNHKIKSLVFLNKLNKLKNLTLNKCELEEINGLNLPELKCLCLKDNKIKYITNNDLKKVTAVYLDKNLITDCKGMADSFPDVGFLSLYNNPIKNNINNLKDLVIIKDKKPSVDIYLNNNVKKTFNHFFSSKIDDIIKKNKVKKEHITMFKEWLKQLKTKELEKEGMADKMVAYIMKSSNKKIKNIDLSGILVSNFPDKLITNLLTHLESADFSNHDLNMRSLDFLNKLTCLKKLTMNNCKIEKISGINLSSLTHLYLGSNEITGFEKCNFKNVDTLDIRRNRIEKCNVIINTFPSLKKIFLMNNPINNIKNNDDNNLSLLFEKCGTKNVFMTAINSLEIKKQCDDSIKNKLIDHIIDKNKINKKDLINIFKIFLQKIHHEKLKENDVADQLVHYIINHYHEGNKRKNLLSIAKDEKFEEIINRLLTDLKKHKFLIPVNENNGILKKNHSTIVSGINSINKSFASSFKIKKISTVHRFKNNKKNSANNFKSSQHLSLTNKNKMIQSMGTLAVVAGADALINSTKNNSFKNIDNSTIFVNGERHV